MPNSESRTYSGQGYDPVYFARKHGLSKAQARDLIRKLGHDRDKLNAAAIAMKRPN
ncbi:MAG TPA: DUF3606 domain-containing protein [Novosphingobium sp.]|nr:DUF3606 domain-containing protein [Novosphingobium sp.]